MGNNDRVKLYGVSMVQYLGGFRVVVVEYIVGGYKYLACGSWLEMKFVLLWDTHHTLPASQNDLAIVMSCIASWGMSNGFNSSLRSR